MAKPSGVVPMRLSVGEQKTNINKKGYPREAAAKTLVQKLECGPGPATPDRIVRVSLTCPLSPRRRRNEDLPQ